MKGFVEWLQALGPLGVFLLAALDSAGIPIVGGVDALLIFVAVARPDAAYPSAGLAVAGSVIGSLLLFLAARKGGEAYLNRYASTPTGKKFKAWFLEYGILTLFVPAAVPVVPTPLKVFVLSAGALGVSPWIFSAVMALARLIRYFLIVWMCMHLGAGTLPYLKHHLWQLTLIAVGMFAALYLLLMIADRRHKLSRIAEKP